MREVSSLPQPGDTIAGKYELERVIGEGGMSVVYGATHRVTGKRFAIKWLLPDDSASSGDTARRFIREAQVAGLFQHPNVVEVYDVGQVAGSFYMVMEWLEGESLADRLARVGTMTFDQVCAYLVPCMHGVVEAHAAGIVHRDLKPANIFLCRAMHHTPERPKVLDFGIAKLSKHVFDVNSLVTKSGVLIGTPHYLSPEQLRSQPIDHRTDIYAFGVIMYQLLTGRLPFPAENFGQLVLQIATGTPEPLRTLAPDLPVGAEAIVERAMSREAADRFQDVRDLIAALEQFSSGASIPVLPGQPTPRSAPPAIPRPSSHAPPPIARPASPNPPTPPAARASEGAPLPLRAVPSRKLLAYLTLAAASAALIGGTALLFRLWSQQPSAADGRAAGKTADQTPSATAVGPTPMTTTTTAAATAPAGETTSPPRTADAPVAEPTAAQDDRAASAREADDAPRAKRPPRPAPPQAATPAPPGPEAPPAASTPTPAPAERNPLDMRLQ